MEVELEMGGSKLEENNHQVKEGITLSSKFYFCLSRGESIKSS